MLIVKFVLVWAVLIPGSAVYLNDYTDCGGHGIMHSILFEPCRKETCDVERGQAYTAHINFTAREHSKTLENICHGIFYTGNGRDLLPFPVSPSDACVGHGVHCPLTPGQSQMYVATVTVPTLVTHTQLRFAGKWEVRDDTGRDLICFVFPLTINKPQH